MTNETPAKSITLYCTANGSDKEYRVELKPSGDGFIVNYANGRRGGSLTHGTKTPTPLPYDKAVAVFDKIVREKKHKEYVEKPGQLAFTGTELAGRRTGIRVQLLTPVTPEEALRLIADDRYVAQQKHDGERRPTVFGTGEGVGGVNKKGLSVPLRATIAEPLATLTVSARTVLDGEEVGDTYFVFDAMEIDGIDLRSLPFVDRYRTACELLRGMPSNIVVSPLAVTTAEKRALYESLIQRDAEGIVFRLAQAPYEQNSIKHKFKESCSVIVIAQNTTKRSVQIGVLDSAGAILPVGNVTIPPNRAMPSSEDVVEVEYLYWYGPGGCLFQPTYKSPRNDIDRDECLVTQLKRKPIEQAA